MASVVRSFLYASLDTSCAITRDLEKKGGEKNRDCRQVWVLCDSTTNRYHRNEYTIAVSCPRASRDASRDASRVLSGAKKLAAVSRRNAEINASADE